MDSKDLRAKVIRILDLTEATKEEQDSALYKVEAIAHKRLSAAIPELLTDEQIDQVESMREAGKPEEEILQWVENQLPDYPSMIAAIIEDVAQEAADL